MNNELLELLEVEYSYLYKNNREYRIKHSSKKEDRKNIKLWKELDTTLMDTIRVTNG